MRKSRYSAAQIVGIVKEHQGGLGAAGLCRKYGISDATFYRWQSARHRQRPTLGHDRHLRI